MAEEKLLVKREGDFHYPIYFEESFAALPEKLKEEGLDGRSVCLVTDTNTERLYKEAVAKVLAPVSGNMIFFTFPAGEQSKTLDTVRDLYQTLIEGGMDRKGLLIALGGGVVGDLTGFAAATYLRGVDFIQLPTTLLAQVDSSVGGKTGVDFQQYKNMVGAFHQPRLVYMNMATLKSLPDREFICGMGEVIKTGLLCDQGLFEYVRTSTQPAVQRDMGVLAAIVRQCCARKAEIVERDPKEKGERALLNLGHTVGHAVEKLMNFQLGHGQCVGLGLLAAGFLSMKRGFLAEAQYNAIRSCCAAYGLPMQVEGLEPQDILSATRKDKKMEQGRIRFILMDGIGRSFITTDLTDEEMLAGIREICA